MKSSKNTKDVQRVLGCEGTGGTGRNGGETRLPIHKKHTRESAQITTGRNTGAKKILRRFSVYSGTEECLSRLQVGGLIGEVDTGEFNHSWTQRGEGCLQGNRRKLPNTQAHNRKLDSQNKSFYNK